MRITYPGADTTVTVAIAPAAGDKSGPARPTGGKAGLPPRRATPSFMFNAFIA